MPLAFSNRKITCSIKCNLWLEVKNWPHCIKNLLHKLYLKRYFFIANYFRDIKIFVLNLTQCSGLILKLVIGKTAINSLFFSLLNLNWCQTTLISIKSFLNLELNLDKAQIRFFQTIWWKHFDYLVSISLTYLFMHSFYSQRSQKCKKTVKSLVSFCNFRIFLQKKLRVKRWRNRPLIKRKRIPFFFN